ncbi:MAG: N-6 DNA methylase [Chitinophagales bacterium]
MGNSLLDDKFPSLKTDYVIANPPFNVSNYMRRFTGTRPTFIWTERRIYNRWQRQYAVDYRQLLASLKRYRNSWHCNGERS